MQWSCSLGSVTQSSREFVGMHTHPCGLSMRKRESGLQKIYGAGRSCACPREETSHDRLWDTVKTQLDMI